MRNRNNPTNRNNNIGFRLASTLNAGSAAFTDAARAPRVRPGPAMMIGGPAAVLRDARARTAAGIDGAGRGWLLHLLKAMRMILA